MFYWEFTHLCRVTRMLVSTWSDVCFTEFLNIYGNSLTECCLQLQFGIGVFLPAPAWDVLHAPAWGVLYTHCNFSWDC